MRHGPLIATVVAAVVGLAACGDDGGGEADTAAACDAYVAVDRAAFDEDPDGVLAGLEDFVASAPDDVASAVEPVIPVLEEDFEAGSESEEMAVADGTADDWALANCGDARVDIEAFNFAFPGVPSEMDAGRVAFNVTNHTQTDEFHEVLLLRRNDGETESPRDIIAAAVESAPVSVETTFGALEHFTLVGGGLVEPEGGDGQDVFVVDLEPGEYIAVCLLPVNSAELLEPYFGGEQVQSRYHFDDGMFAQFTVG